MGPPSPLRLPMTAATAPFSPRWIRVVLTTGLIAAACDAVGATVHYLANGGRTPLRIWTYVASAAFGPSAQTGGAPYVAAGLAFHVVIATAWSALYFVLASRIVLLRTRVMPSAILYGAGVWSVMNLVVVPSSRIPARPLVPLQAAIAAAVLMLCIGLPNALRCRQFYRAA